MTPIRLLFCATLFAACTGLADPATGWLRTGAGPYDYNDPENWVDGEINGVFGADLALTANQTVTFAADTELADGLQFAYAGNFTLTLKSDGAGPRTLTLGGGIVSAMQGSAAAVVTLGGADDEALAVDFGGECRTIAANSANGALVVAASLQNGALSISGDKTVKLAGANTYAGGTTIDGKAYVYLESETALGTGPVSVNGEMRFLNSRSITLTADNVFYFNAPTIVFQVADKMPMNIGSGDVIATNAVKVYADGKNSIEIGGRILDGDGVCKPSQIEKWGSQTMITRSPMVTDGDTIVLGNGVWNFYGSIEGTDLAVSEAANTGVNDTQHLKLMGANANLTGSLTLGGNSVYVYASAEGSVPPGLSITIPDKLFFVCSDKVLASTLVNNGQIDVSSTGTLCLGANETASVDMTAYPRLRLGANGGDRTLTGVITPAADGVWRLGGGGKSIVLASENALTGPGRLEVYGANNGNVILKQSNDFTGGVRIFDGGVLEIKDDTGVIPSSDVDVHGGTFYVNSSASTGRWRAGTVTLHSGTFQYQGNKSKEVSDSVDSIVLDVRDPEFGTVGGVCSIKMLSAGNTARFHAGELVRRNGAIFRLNGTANGGSIRVGGRYLATDPNTVLFTVGNGQEYLDALVGGGGAAGEKTVSVYPFAAVDNATYNDSLVTYDGNGFRGLDMDEFTDGITPGEDSFNNVRLPVGSTTELTADARVNSVFLQGSDPNKGNTVLSGAVTLGVRSGVVVLGYHRNAKPMVQCDVDFGSQPGVVCSPRGKGSYWNGAMHGEAGLVYWQTANLSSTDSGGTGLNIGVGAVTGSTLAGDVIVHGYLVADIAGALPGGTDRPGDLYVYGHANVKAAGWPYHGVFGTGFLFRNGEKLDIGNGDADGDFEGGFIGSTQVQKSGEGRQRVAGNSTHTGATTVEAGVLQVDGAFSDSAVTVRPGATLAGCGEFSKAVTVADGASLEAGSAERGAEDVSMDFAGDLVLQGAASLGLVCNEDGTVSRVEVGGTLTIPSEAVVTVSVGEGEPTPNVPQVVLRATQPLDLASFVRGTRCGRLALGADGTELLMTFSRGLSVVIR